MSDPSEFGMQIALDDEMSPAIARAFRGKSWVWRVLPYHVHEEKARPQFTATIALPKPSHSILSSDDIAEESKPVGADSFPAELKMMIAKLYLFGVQEPGKPLEDHVFPDNTVAIYRGEHASGEPPQPELFYFQGLVAANKAWKQICESAMKDHSVLHYTVSYPDKVACKITNLHPVGRQILALGGTLTRCLTEVKVAIEGKKIDAFDDGVKSAFGMLMQCKGLDVLAAKVFGENDLELGLVSFFHYHRGKDGGRRESPQHLIKTHRVLDEIELTNRWGVSRQLRYNEDVLTRRDEIVLWSTACTVMWSEQIQKDNEPEAHRLNRTRSVSWEWFGLQSVLGLYHEPDSDPQFVGLPGYGYF